jgi:NADH-quinone oxidoreductase subunit K
MGLVHDVPLSWFLALALYMFVTGAVGVVVRRNPVVVFMCIELMLNAVNVVFLAFARYQPSSAIPYGSSMDVAMSGQMMVIFVMAVAAAEVAVGLGIITAVFRLKNRADIDDLSAMRG